MNFSDNVIDTRDIQDRIDEINDEIDTLKEEINDLSNEIDDLEEEEEDGNQSLIDEKLDDIDDKKGEIEVLQEELKQLLEIKDEVPEFEDGNTLINADYWVEYCEELCKDCGYLSSDLPWWIEIDWEKTAENIAVDYSIVEIQGETFYYRNC